MKFTLHRTVNAIRYKVLATIDVEQSRQDIQTILEQVVRDASSLPPRAINYLEKEGLVKEQSLTEKGQRVRETGLLSCKERGIYTIWYLDNDEHLGTVPLILQRMEEPLQKGYRAKEQFYNWPEQRREQKDSWLHCDSAIVCIMADSAEERRIQNLKIEVLNLGERSRRCELDLSLRAGLTKDNQIVAGFHLEGGIPIRIGKDEKQIPVHREYGIEEFNTYFMDQLADSLGLDWFQSNMRFKSPVPDNSRTLLSFIQHQVSLEYIETIYGVFEHGEARKLPLMPSSRAIAADWQHGWLVETLKDAYLEPSRLCYQQQVWLEHPAIKGFELEIQEGERLLSQMNAHQCPQSYWHASASHYLLPQSDRNTLPSMTFRNGAELSVSDLLRGLVLSEPVQAIIYSDRHYKSKKHVKNMKFLARACGAQKGFVFSEEATTPVPKGWQLQKLERQKDNHDRYWILVTSSRMLIWKCTTSLDFVDFSVPEPRVQGSPTFIQIEDRDLPEYLQAAVVQHGFMEAA